MPARWCLAMLLTAMIALGSVVPAAAQPRDRMTPRVTALGPTAYYTNLYITTYYSDATKTTQVGQYTYSECSGTETFYGEQTAYYTERIRREICN